MSARGRLALILVLSGGCSAHSLDYLQRGEKAVSAAGQAGSADTGGSLPAAGAPPAGMSSGGAAGDATPASSCDDLLANGDESDADCGGRACAPCDAGKHCLLGSDCASAICSEVMLP